MDCACVRVRVTAFQVHVSDSAIDGGAGKLQSVTDRHELDEFLCDALLKESEFEVQHSSMVRKEGTGKSQRRRCAVISLRTPLAHCVGTLHSLTCAPSFIRVVSPFSLCAGDSDV